MRESTTMRLPEIVPKFHRSYVRSHRLGIAVSTALCLAGAVGLLAPYLVDESAPALSLPAWAFVVFNVVWAVGGGLGAYGLIRGRPAVEGPGDALLAGGLFSYYIAVVSIRGWSGAITGLFIGALALGYAARAHYVFFYGYDGGCR